MTCPSRRLTPGGMEGIVGLKSLIYQLLKYSNDANAVKEGKVGRRVGRRVAGKVAGRAMGKLFR